MILEAGYAGATDRWTTILRGIGRRCPRCGRGRLFQSYLKLAERCDACGELFATLRADDGPAWATIIVVGHLMVPFFLIAVRDGAPDWVSFGVLLPMTLLLTVALLPRFKGVFAAILWTMHTARATS